MSTFESILDQPATAFERPKPLPQGSYICAIKGLPRHDKTTRKQTEFVEFQLQPLQAGDDVDEEELTAALSKADGSVKSLQDANLRITFYITPEATYRLVDFLHNDLGIEKEDKSTNQMITEATGRQVIAFVKHVWSDDGQSVYANVVKTAPVE